MQDKDYGVYFEYVLPKTGFIQVRALTEKEARIIAEKNFKQNPGFKILGVWEVIEKLTYQPPEQKPAIIQGQQ